MASKKQRRRIKEIVIHDLAQHNFYGLQGKKRQEKINREVKNRILADCKGR